MTIKVSGRFSPKSGPSPNCPLTKVFTITVNDGKSYTTNEIESVFPYNNNDLTNCIKSFLDTPTVRFFPPLKCCSNYYYSNPSMQHSNPKIRTQVQLDGGGKWSTTNGEKMV
jgi:hypothetical protein